MPDILIEVTIAATPENVFEALTEQNGLASWWTTHAIAQPTVGAMVRVSFRNDERAHVFDVVALEPARKIVWHTRQSFLPDWLGTRITWDLTPVDNSTIILFTQRGFATENGSLPKVTYSWAVVITSLKAYLETGKGTPQSY